MFSSGFRNSLCLALGDSDGLYKGREPFLAHGGRQELSRMMNIQIQRLPDDFAQRIVLHTAARQIHVFQIAVRIGKAIEIQRPHQFHRDIVVSTPAVFRILTVFVVGQKIGVRQMDVHVQVFRDNIVQHRKPDIQSPCDLIPFSLENVHANRPVAEIQHAVFFIGIAVFPDQGNKGAHCRRCFHQLQTCFFYKTPDGFQNLLLYGYRHQGHGVRVILVVRTGVCTKVRDLIHRRGRSLFPVRLREHGVIIHILLRFVRDKIRKLVRQIHPQLIRRHLRHLDDPCIDVLILEHIRRKAAADPVFLHRIAKELSHCLLRHDFVVLDQIKRERRAHHLLHCFSVDQGQF